MSLSGNENTTLNSNGKERTIYLQVLLGCFLVGLFYVLTFGRSSVLGLGVSSRAGSTRTAIALTSRALYGPFPTATGHTPTASKTRTATPTPTIMPSNTASSTPIHYFIDTATPRTAIPQGGATPFPGVTSTSAPLPTQPLSTQPLPTRTSVPPTIPPILPTKTSAPPVQPTQPVSQPTPCRNPRGHPIPCH